MTTTKKLITAEELFELGDCYPNVELIDGELREVTPPGWEHGTRTLEVATVIRRFVRERGLGQVAVGDPGIVLRRGPDVARAPDVAFISAERLPADRPI